MAFFKWLDSYSVGIKAMDEQHKKLIEMVDQLHEAMKTGAGNEVMGGVISSLVKYTVTHFSTEERLMQQYGYPGYHDHQRAHGEMIRKVQEVNAKYTAGTPGITVELMAFLRSWLITHIQGEDQAYGRYIAAH